MLIGIDASRYCHDKPTGVEIYSKEIIEALLPYFQNQKTHTLRLYTPQKISSLPAKLQRLLPYHRLWTQRYLSREIRQNPPAVLFVPSHVLPLSHPKKSIITIHDLAFRDLPLAYHPLQWLYLHWSTWFAVKKAFKIIVPSQATKKDLINKYNCPPEKIIIILHGFKPPKSKISTPKTAKILKTFHLLPKTTKNLASTPNPKNTNQKLVPYILFIGRLETKKNLSRLMQAFKIFSENHPEWRLILGGGRGTGFNKILKTLLKEKLTDRVLMPGYLTEDEKAILLKNARLFAFPSLAEGFGFPILEAAHYHVPILASKIPALLEFKNYVDIFVDPLNVHSLAKGLTTLAANSQIKKSPSLAKYSWKKNAKTLYNLLTSL
ncbi:MAG: hypothetical protein UT55_C0095G0004 [Candidatus Peregrinibacteria bacterium GW2011_GWE2_39_6]|nr:MAG: hypothetical protein UT36_C0005G0055 [Candidatus Peregrinibacteria bacterium GW2011_GWF2_39_17]KKR23370.1 MAG: hypothetical protein UT55_C0095G0004 [Candidatus Peregrinibacteria bacterium GW2011_GWE2_39_6]HCW32891.1 hypothetical protein [Candidatus Peregrinibacteria bacterium]